jgi:hypothetical protein
MTIIYPQCPDSGSPDRWAADLLLRQAPNDEENEDEDDRKKKEDDDDEGAGYSE